MKSQVDNSSETLENLLFRRQFVFGPEEINNFPSWNKFTVGNETYLSVHPDLEAYRTEIQNKSITLIGYILDPNNIQARNSDIVDGLIREFDKVENIIEHTNEFGGRWILIVNDGQKSILFHDAAGLRQIYYTHSSLLGKICCASQPSLLANALDLEMDKEAFEFMRSRESVDNYDNYKIYWWPGDTSLYREIKLLLPNHYLDLRTGISNRYWPKRKLNTIPLKDAITKSSTMLRGLMMSAYNRYDLALSLTAGWDSRVMLGVSKEIIHDLYCFTLAYPGLKGNNSDVIIPSALMKKLGVKHNLIKYPEPVNEEFKNLHRKNNPSVNNAYCADVQAMYDQMPKYRMCITGDVAEVVKCYYRIPGKNGGKVSAHDLAALTDMGTHPFVIDAFEKWLSDIESHNIHVLDLFSWEQVGGRLQAQNQAECDIVLDTFAPYNCRNLLSTILSVDEKHRKPPVYTFHSKLIAKLWKEILSEPINPPEKTTLKSVLMNVLIKLHVYHLIPETVKSFAKRII